MVSRSLPHSRFPRRDGSGRFTGAGIALLLHVAAIAVLLQFQPVRQAITQAVPIMVSLITPPPPVVEKPKVLPRPLPVKPRAQRVEPPRPEPPLVAAVTDAPPPPTAPAAVAPPSPPAPVVAPPAAPPAPLVPPNFNAAYLNNPAPAYPPLSRRAGHQGKVILRVLVNAAGSPDGIELRTSSGVGSLDEAALEAVRRWRFLPARQGENAVPAWVLVPIIFTLER